MIVQRVCGLFLLAASVFAAVDGTVVNGTTGQPASGVSVALVQPSAAGMQRLGETKTDAQGKFTLPQRMQGPGLLQATYEGVTYSKMVMPSAPSSGLTFEVFDATKKPVAQVSQHMILIQPTGSDLNISETFLVQGDPKLTYNDPENGSLRFYLPDGVKDALTARVTFGASGVPVQRPATKTREAHVYSINYPMRPGETRVDLTYTVPEGTPPVFASKILHKEEKARLVVPNGVSLKGDTIQEVGKEPQTQATIYDINGPAYKVEVSGTGSLQPPEPSGDEDAGQPQIQQAPPHVYKHIYWLMGLAFGILGLGTYLLARNSIRT